MTNDIVEAKELMQVSDSLYKGYGKGYTYTAVTRMMKVARYYSDEEMFATLSQTLSQINNGSLTNSIVQYLSPKNMVIIRKNRATRCNRS